jgi:hypothetical protein
MRVMSDLLGKLKGIWYWVKYHKITSALILLFFVTVRKIWCKIFNLDLNALLTVATYLLAIASVHHAEEVGIDRKIALKEKRLEKLYTPILNNQVYITNPIFLPDDALKILNELQRFTHLAHDEVKEDIEKYLAKAAHAANLKKANISRDSEYYEEIKKSGEELIEKIKEKAEKDRNRLKELRP